MSKSWILKYLIRFIKIYNRKKNSFSSSENTYKTMSRVIVMQNQIAETHYQRIPLKTLSQKMSSYWKKITNKFNLINPYITLYINL